MYRQQQQQQQQQQPQSFTTQQQRQQTALITHFSNNATLYKDAINAGTGRSTAADLPSPELLFGIPDLDSPADVDGKASIFFEMVAQMQGNSPGGPASELGHAMAERQRRLSVQLLPQSRQSDHNSTGIGVIGELKRPQLSTSTGTGHCSTSNSNGRDITLADLEQEFEALKSSQTDPIGKFLKEQNITAHEAEQLNIVQYLLDAPKKQREKYGKRKPISKEEKLAVQKERNREHARATRERQKLFKMITQIREGAAGKNSGAGNSNSAQNCNSTMMQEFYSQPRSELYTAAASSSSSSSSSALTPHGLEQQQQQMQHRKLPRIDNMTAGRYTTSTAGTTGTTQATSSPEPDSGDPFFVQAQHSTCASAASIVPISAQDNMEREREQQCNHQCNRSIFSESQQECRMLLVPHGEESQERYTGEVIFTSDDSGDISSPPFDASSNINNLVVAFSHSRGNHHSERYNRDECSDCSSSDEEDGECNSTDDDAVISGSGSMW